MLGKYHLGNPNGIKSVEYSWVREYKLMKKIWQPEELVEHWTLLPDELGLPLVLQS